MKLRFAKMSLALVLAFGAATGVHAQSKNAAVVPVYNNASNKLEAYLLLEPTNAGSTGWRFGGSDLDAAFGLDPGDSLALLCNRKTGQGAAALSSLVNNCALGAVGDDSGNSHGSAGAGFSRGGNRVGITAGTGRARLPAWLTAGNPRSTTQANINDITVFAEKDIGRQGVVSIAGTTAKAELIPVGEAPAEISDRWNTSSLSVGGGYGAFSANIIGHVVDMPGQPKWEGLGLGLSWRTPWSGQLTVGADNLVTRGKNPFSPTIDTTTEEGAVPYVRYEQDL